MVYLKSIQFIGDVWGIKLCFKQFKNDNLILYFN